MMIQELTPDMVEPVEAPTSVPNEFERLVEELEQGPSSFGLDKVDALSSAALAFSSSSDAGKTTEMWKLSYRIWNACVDISNRKELTTAEKEKNAKLRNIAADVLLAAGESSAVHSSLLKIAMFFQRTGCLWIQLNRFETAEACLAKATELCTKAKDVIKDDDPAIQHELTVLSFDVHVARAKASWEVNQTALASNILGRALLLLPQLPEKAVDLADMYLQFGKAVLNASSGSEGAVNATSYFEKAFEICSDGIVSLQFEGKMACKKAMADLRDRTLRYLAGAHVQCGRYEDALKCTSILKSGFPLHPSVPFLELKALSALGKHDAAEEELSKLTDGDTAKVDIVGAAIEIITASGSSSSVPAAKTAFFNTLNKFPSCGKFSRQFLTILVQQGASRLACVEAAIEVGQDHRVVASLLSKTKSLGVLVHDDSSDQHSVHALFWNCGSEQFSRKNYTMSVKLFETSLLYLEDDRQEQRAKALRVICLCHMGLLQYDRASECIQLAEEIDPCIASVFLKQKSEARAAQDVEKMISCKDFEPDYLALASHEALASGQSRVAVQALRQLQKLISAGTKIGMVEAVVVRNIITLVTEKVGNMVEALEFFQVAISRVAAIGTEGFFALLADGDTSEASLNKAATTLEKCQKIMSKCKAEGQDTSGTFFQLLMFDVKGRQKDCKGQQEIIERCRAMPGFKAEHFFQMGLHSARDCADSTVASAAFSAGLHMMMTSKSPDYRVVAAMYRKLISLADIQTKDGVQVYDLYMEAHQLLIGLPAESYPRDELHWLISTAWNRAPILARFRRFEEAEKWMKLAMKLAERAPSMESSRLMMSDAVAEVELMKNQESNPMEE
ncbi:hypothetical protein CLOP_g1512 [Closterium sp. NIES-67]|nr:hypothetical protein CLOP_g1512 [Closterium sp. NIES-67]